MMERAAKSISKLRLAAGATPEEVALSAWPAAVGKRIAGYAVARSLVRTRLVVDVEDAIWQKQLFHLRFQILAKLSGLIGPGLVEDVEFRIGLKRRPPQYAGRLDADVAADAEAVADPVLRLLYERTKKKRMSS